MAALPDESGDAKPSWDFFWKCWRCESPIVLCRCCKYRNKLAGIAWVFDWLNSTGNVMGQRWIAERFWARGIPPGCRLHSHRRRRLVLDRFLKNDILACMTALLIYTCWWVPRRRHPTQIVSQGSVKDGVKRSDEQPNMSNFLLLLCPVFVD